MSEETNNLSPDKLDKLREGISTLKAGMDVIKDLPPALRTKVLNQILGTTDKPPGFAATTTAAYYKEKYALVVKNLLDKHFVPQTEDHRENLFYHRDHLKGIQPRSLAILFNQAWQYLDDHLDPEGKYALLRAMIEVQKLPNGVKLAWKETAVSDAILNALEVPIKIDPSKDHKRNSWRLRFEHFIDTAVDDQKFEEGSLALKPHDQEYIRDTLVQLNEFHLLKLNGSNILILKDSKLKKEV